MEGLVRILVTGGRTFHDREWLWAALDYLGAIKPITGIIEGGAPGADTCAYEWAYRREIPCLVVPAQWEKHGRSAGMIRNREMAELRPDIVLACPGGKGTTNMVETAKAMGLKVIFLEKMPVPKGAPSPAERPVVILDQAA